MSAYSTSEVTSGSRPTFEQFFAEMWPGAFRLASFLTHSTEAGEDVAQEVLSAMAQRWGELDNPAGYLRTSLVNASWNWNRHTRAVRTKLPLLFTAQHEDFKFDELADAIARLPFRQRAVIILRYYAGLSEAEIASALSCRKGTVKSLASRALDALSKEVTR